MAAPISRVDRYPMLPESKSPSGMPRLGSFIASLKSIESTHYERRENTSRQYIPEEINGRIRIQNWLEGFTLTKSLPGG
jgi:hypothetical protein